MNHRMNLHDSGISAYFTVLQVYSWVSAELFPSTYKLIDYDSAENFWGTKIGRTWGRKVWGRHTGGESVQIVLAVYCYEVLNNSHSKDYCIIVVSEVVQLENAWDSFGRQSYAEMHGTEIWIPFLQFI